MTPKDHTATQGASESSERRLFEAWALKKHYAYRNKHGVWFYDFSEPLWRGWQGGRETALAQRQPAPSDPQAAELSMSMFATLEDYEAAQGAAIAKGEQQP